MREIKFRVWNKDINCYMDEIYTPYNTLINSTRFEDLLFEQYTGLKDKNKREIYEGDIIFLEREVCSERGEFENYTEKTKFVVEFKNGSFGKVTEINHEHWTISKFDVIGNILDNPELLNN